MVTGLANCVTIIEPICLPGDEFRRNFHLVISAGNIRLDMLYNSLDYVKKKRPAITGRLLLFENY